jgi:hypothetical protein
MTFNAHLWVSAAFAAGLLVMAGTAEAAAQEKISLSVLYAGIPDAPRTKEFQQFLGQHFTKVGLAPFTEFKPEMADGYDVVIFDAPVPVLPDRIGVPPVPVLPRDFNRASVLVAGPGVNIARALDLKIDWY